MKRFLKKVMEYGIVAIGVAVTTIGIMQYKENKEIKQVKTECKIVENQKVNAIENKYTDKIHIVQSSYNDKTHDNIIKSSNGTILTLNYDTKKYTIYDGLTHETFTFKEPKKAVTYFNNEFTTIAESQI